MKRGALLLTMLVAAFAAACSGGGGGGTTPPPPPNGFSNSSLKGQYAFIMTGQTLADPNGQFIARIGTFIADGNGGIQAGGTELVSTASTGLQLLPFNASTYQVKSDGRGAINLNNLNGTLSFSITLVSTTQGYISQTDGVTTTSGTFELQDTSAFTLSGINGSYVFDNSGLDPTNNPDSIIGQLNLSSGGVTGVFDENDGALASGPQVFNTGGSYSFSDFNNGIGTIFFGGFEYDFVVVSNKKIHMIEVPGQGSSLPVTVGTANAQTNPPATNAALTGSFAYLISGIGTQSQNEKAGRFTTDGNGGLVTSSLALDDKEIKNPITQIPSGTLSAATYSIDTTLPGSGRGTLTFKDSSKGTFQFIFYMASATQGFIQDNGNGLVGDGVIMAQTGGPFSLSTVANDYAFNLSGVSVNDTTSVQGEEDFVGHMKFTNATSNNVMGMMDFSELNLVDPTKDAIHDSVISGGLTINGDGTNSSGSRSGLTITATNPLGGPSTTFPFTVYVVNPTTIFVISQDKNRVTGGAMTVQITPP